MSGNRDDTTIVPGDLVVILSSTDATPMDVPPGLVLKVAHGKPTTGYPDASETRICSILWRGFVDKWVSAEWLKLVSRA
jgi:hypothetical protein